jgi:light-regulated signal transduction histidine kinase (bacteriophytochrome)
MSTALRDVLNYASLQKTETFGHVDLDEVLASVQTDLELVIAEKKAKIQSDELPTIVAITRQMHQLFYNLLNNALKFTGKDKDPVITITCQALHQSDLQEHEELAANHSYFLISIKDNGIGFDQSFAEKIFVLFQRLHSKDAYAGTGIGLALCKKVVSNHGGKIWAESKPGEGATFRVLLPAGQ